MFSNVNKSNNFDKCLKVDKFKVTKSEVDKCKVYKINVEMVTFTTLIKVVKCTQFNFDTYVNFDTLTHAHTRTNNSEKTS